MIKPETKKLLVDLGQNVYGKALKEFLDNELDTLKNIVETKSWEETLGRQYAVKLIEKLFGFMKDAEIPVKTKNQYE